MSHGHWHLEWCDSPDVVSPEGIPFCRTCNNDALRVNQTLVSEQTSTSSEPGLLQEKQIGQLDLWWPPKVPYTHKSRTEYDNLATSATASRSINEIDHSLSEVYPFILKKNHFRLLYVFGSEASGDPIHATLEEFPLADCPEYETVSYTWGDEDGNSTPCMPIYLGKFWEVLLVTRNCWSLLQYLRPYSGCRIVWVDAICINQRSDLERSAQVALMDRIYIQCMRVLVYLGNNVVEPTKQRFRPKVRASALKELLLGRDIQDLLSKRYFGRVWIIQELILAPYAVMPLGQVDVYLGRGELFQAIISSQQEENSKSWLQYMGDAVKLNRHTILGVLEQTMESQASDPRDKIFGVVGLLQQELSTDLTPDYSLPYRDVVVGVMAYVLLVEHETWPLIFAPHSKGKTNYPSWLPKIEDMAHWKPQIRIQLEGKDPNPAGISTVGTQNWYPAVDQEPKNWVSFISLRYFGDFPSPGDIDNLVGRGISIAYLSQEKFPGGQYFSLHPHKLLWHSNCQVESKTASLHLYVVRIFEGAHQFSATGEYPYTWLWARGPTSAARFAVWTPPTHILERPCHAFLLWESTLAKNYHIDSPAPLLLLATESEDTGHFKLVWCCRLRASVFMSVDDLEMRVPMPTPKSDEVILSSLHKLLSDVKQATADEISSGGARFVFNLIFPGGLSETQEGMQIIISFLIAIRCEEDSSKQASELDSVYGACLPVRLAYKSCLQRLSSKYQPDLDDDFVYFTLPDIDTINSFSDILSRHSESSQERLSPEIKVEGHSDWDDLMNSKHLKRLKPSVQVRMSLEAMISIAQEKRLYRLIRDLEPFCRLTGENMIALLERDPRSEDHIVFLYDWPKSLLNELGFVWRPERVTLV
ncbi:heterokaryon incompatibility protein-domain-containing protein [Nemania diffusa]|nr:heterokaryon incompatibility protein-domain-containing protein [Nemania diffusa]